jgi:hypothetical protein
MEKLQMPFVVVIGQSDKGQTESHGESESHGDHDEHQRRIEVSEQHPLGGSVWIEVGIRLISQSNSDGGEAEGDESPGRDDGAAKGSHGKYLVG